MKIFTFLSILLSIIVVTAQGREVKGVITDTQGKPIPYANIYVPKLKTGTTSNIEGEYSIDLPDEELELLFQYIGYRTRKVVLSELGDLELNVKLQEQVVQIKEIKVLASGEDPAYYVMRKAISMAPYYANQVSEYDCKVYLKGTGVLDKIPRLFRKKLKKEGLEQEKPFVVESISEVHFEQPNKLEQKVIAMRSSGSDNNTSPQEMITNNLYQTSKYGIISPFSKQALSVYSFKLEGVFVDQERTINKIRVIPKRKGKDLFRGIINVAEDYWNIHSADLQLSLPMTEVKMRQQYAAVNENTWMPVSLNFDINFKGLGFAFKYQYVASVSDYKTTLNPNLDHSFFEKKTAQIQAENEVLNKIVAAGEENDELVEIKKTKRQKRIEQLAQKESLTNGEVRKMQRLIAAEAKKHNPPEPLEIKNPITMAKNATKNDSVFWGKKRPIPLTLSEVESFSKKDSIVAKEKSPGYKDSIRREQRHFKLGHIFTGKYYAYKNDSAKYFHWLKVPGFIDVKDMVYNTVDGFRFPVAFSYGFRDTLGRSLFVSPRFAYTTARKHWDFDLYLWYSYNPAKMEGVGARVGRITTDLNPNSGISRMENSINTLYFGRNHKKFISRDIARVHYRRELINGLDFKVKLAYEQYEKLTNNTTYIFNKNEKKRLTPNIPQRLWGSEDISDFEGTANVDILINYTPRRRYFMSGKRKIAARSKFPTFSFRYKKGIPNVFNSDTNFDFMSLGISDRMSSGFNDSFSYKVEGGIFLNNKKVNFTDYAHFRTDNTRFGDSFRFDSFRLLPFYTAATNDKYLKVFTQWESDRLLLKRLPLLNNSMMTEHVFVNYLTTPDWKNYWEIGYGLQNVFLLGNIEIVHSRQKAYQGFSNSTELRITFNLN
ncbi:carboxypeptidase-like regulatory domain-containing protein [Prolixibacteraceae bacterium JC049]|nr:carboxypeptidase-like regulatory domain-containing protein [Prolixibacteraceae bacterium JC049]